MKTHRFVKNWLFTILAGGVIGCLGTFFDGGSVGDALLIGTIFLILSILASLPFILIMIAFAKNWSKKQVSKRQFHLNTFLVHFTITVLTILAINISYGSDYIFWPSVFVIFAYFAFDSILIHYSINKHYGEQFEERIISENPELLDDF